VLGRGERASLVVGAGLVVEPRVKKGRDRGLTAAGQDVIALVSEETPLPGGLSRPDRSAGRSTSKRKTGRPMSAPSAARRVALP